MRVIKIIIIRFIFSIKYIENLKYKMYSNAKLSIEKIYKQK